MRIPVSCLAAGLSLFVVSCSSTTGEAAPIPVESPAAEAQALLEQILEQDHGPGVMAAVYRDGQLVWSGTAGMADLENGIALTPDHRLRIGSVSKPLTAVLALKLSEDGTFDVTEDIRSWVPAFVAGGETVTAEQIASHTSGIRHYDFSNYAEANSTLYYHRLEDALGSFAGDPLLSAPGEAFHYSSLAFNLLGAALENATGESFVQLMQAYVAGPLSMENTLPDNPFDIIPRRAGFYTVTAENPVFPWMKNDEVINTIMRDSSDYYPSGGMLASAEDLARFTSAVFEGGFLSEESLQRVTTPVSTAGGVDTGYSFGWEVLRNEDGDIAAYGHGGETNGGYALIRYFPETGLSVAGIVNYNSIGREPSFFDAIEHGLPGIFSE